MNTYPDFDSQTNTSKEDQMLEDLICTNIMQRGVGNVNPLKLAKCAVELERIYGIQVGNNQHNNSLRNNFVSSKSQEDVANDLNITTRQLQNYKKLLSLIPELQDMVEDDEIKATTATYLAKKLSQDEQEKLIQEIKPRDFNIPWL